MRAYREIWAQLHDQVHLPSALAISVLFGGWERAREHVAFSSLRRRR
jgi:hypothetical protein